MNVTTKSNYIAIILYSHNTGEQMKYNILTVANHSYFNFLKLFISSARRYLPENKINFLYVYDTGLTSQDLEWLSTRDVVVRPTKVDMAKMDNIHDEVWETITYSKTSFLKDSLMRDPTPTIMVDVDCMFVNDMFFWLELFEGNRDFILCRTTYKKPKYIGCFFAAIDIKESLPFLDLWIKQIPKMNTMVKESPALSKVVEDHSLQYNYGEIRDKVICAPVHLTTPDSCILHMKSYKDIRTVDQRITQKEVLPYLKELDL